MFALTRAENRSRASTASRQAASPRRAAGHASGSAGGTGHLTGQRCACGGGCPRCQAEIASGTSAKGTTHWHPEGQGTNGGGESALKGGGPSRNELFCHKCKERKSLKVSVYSQWSSDFRESNITFAKVVMANHNIALDVEHAGVIPHLYDEDKKRFGKVDTVNHLCDIVRDLERQGSLPPASGAAALFLPFGQGLRDKGETVGWHIPDINVTCQDLVGKLKTTRVLLIDSSPDVKSCSKVLLHEIGHAVGNVDIPESQMIMGPCDPSSPQEPSIGCNPESTHNLMTAVQVKKFCAGAS